MLSKGAFNALLKTLEEPPEHVKFIFATTEIRKVPVTVLSRCQRFDLRRVDVPVLSAHFKQASSPTRARRRGRCAGADRPRRRRLGARRPVPARPGDRHGAGEVSAGRVRGMLGLADRGAHLRSARALFGRPRRRRSQSPTRCTRRRRPGADAGRPRRARHRVTRASRCVAAARRRGLAPRTSARAARRSPQQAVGAAAVARLADAAQGPRGGAPRPTRGCRRDGADPARATPPTCRRPTRSSTRSAAVQSRVRRRTAARLTRRLATVKLAPAAERPHRSGGRRVHRRSRRLHLRMTTGTPAGRLAGGSGERYADPGDDIGPAVAAVQQRPDPESFDGGSCAGRAEARSRG